MAEAAPSPWLRAAAAVGALALPALWLASLAGTPDFLHSNVPRVAGALLGAGWVWTGRFRGNPGAPASRYILAGVVGSLAVTGLSVLVPALGRPEVSGWLVSGAVGGGMLALAVFAAEGRVSRRPTP